VKPALGAALAESLDPVVLARRLGWEPDTWQAEELRSSEQWTCLNVHRQGGKSQVAALKGVHVATHEPGSTVALVSPTMRQSQELFRRVQVFWRAMGRPVRQEQENLTAMTLENGSRIVCMPGDPDTIRGLAAVRLLVIDEAARVSDDLMIAVRPMLAVSGGQLLALSTPWGRRGWWYRAVTGEGTWKVVTIPATSCPRIRPEFLAAERAEMGDLKYRSEYMCEFVEGAGAFFNPADVFGAITAIEPLDPFAPPTGLRLVTDQEQAS
jgi:hypothetical protein